MNWPTPNVSKLAMSQRSDGIARVEGLPSARRTNFRFDNGITGLAQNLDPREIGVVLVTSGIQEGMKAVPYRRRTVRTVGDASWVV